MHTLISTRLKVLPLYTPMLEPIISGTMIMLRRCVLTASGFSYRRGGQDMRGDHERMQHGWLGGSMHRPEQEEERTSHSAELLNCRPISTALDNQHSPTHA